MRGTKKTISKVFVVIGFLVFTNVLVAQDDKKDSPLQNMQFLVADWKVSNFENKEGKWHLVGDTQSSIKAILEGSFLSENVKYLLGSNELNMVVHIGYDERIDGLKLSAMDQEYGLMDIYTGEFLGEKIVFTNLKSDRPILSGDGKKLSFKLTYSNIQSDSFEHLVEGSYDEGLTWFPFTKSIYQKLN